MTTDARNRGLGTTEGGGLELCSTLLAYSQGGRIATAISGYLREADHVDWSPLNEQRNTLDFIACGS